MINCDHATVDLPDPLPPAVAAALRLRADEGISVRRIVTILHWAVLGEHMVDRRSEWTPDALCALVRSHPAVQQPGPGMCARAAEAFAEAGRAKALPDRTELGLAERVAVMCRARLAWSDDDLWRVWTGRRWEVDQGSALAMEQVKHVARTLLPEETEQAARLVVAAKRLDPTGGTDETKALIADEKAARAFAKSAQSARTMRAALELLRREPMIFVPAAEWDADDRLLNVANGTVELRESGAFLRDHRAEDRITHIAAGRYLPGAERELWDSWLADVQPDPPVRDYLARHTGHALLGGNPRRVLLILVGGTSTRKTTFIESVAAAMGEYAAPFRLGLFVSEREGGRARTDLHEAMPRRMIFTTEASESWKLESDQVKRLTGGDTDAARTLFSGTYRSGRPQFVPIVATNSAPTIRQPDPALWRRINAVPFMVPVAVDDEDETIVAQLRQQVDGILTWAIDGFDQYTKRGLSEVPQACSDAVAMIRRDLSLEDAWLAERCELGEDFREAAADLNEDYWAWCRANRIAPADQLSGPVLGKRLAARGLASKVEEGQRVKVGVRLLPGRELAVGDVLSVNDPVREHAPGCACPGCLHELLRPDRRRS